jgi:hypothetical protein
MWLERPCSGRWYPGGRQRDARDQPLRPAVVERQRAAVRLGDGARNRQAEAEAGAVVHGACFLTAHEGFQHRGLAVVRNAGAVVDKFADIDQVMQDFLKLIQDSQDNSGSSYSASGSSLLSQIQSLIVNYQA